MLVSWDNASIHQFPGGVARLGLQPDQYLELPPQSPDFHQLIEHCFGNLKNDLVVALYKQFWEAPRKETQDWVIAWCHALKPSKLQKGLAKLPVLYRIVSAPKGYPVWDGHKFTEGTGGDWAPKGWR